MSTTTLSAEVAAFASAVRAALADLPAEDVEDLTEGLEADLTERAEDLAADELGDPVAYAEELRSAAGFPARSGRRPRDLPGALSHSGRELVTTLRELYGHPLISRVAGFFVALRPLWWLIRAWVFYGILTAIFHAPSLELTPLTFFLGAASMVVSVQFGRGKWLPRVWMRRTLLAVNVILVLLTPLVLLATSSAILSANDRAYASVQDEPDPSNSGLTYDGVHIRNIFAYDSSGKPVTVQLFDQDGNPIYTFAHPNTGTAGDHGRYVPGAGATSGSGWNIFPLERLTPGQLDASGDAKVNALASPVKPKYPQVPPLLVAPTPTATPTPTPTPTPLSR